LYDTAATLALLHHGMTLPAVVGAALFSHEDALRPRLYRLTNHGYHLLPALRYKKNPLQNHLKRVLRYRE
jgi:hypothetical protein